MLSILSADVWTPSLSSPYGEAEMVSLVEEEAAAESDERLEFPFVAGRASRVKRSEMDLSCERGGSRICTSGSRQRGSWILATEAGARTVTGMDWVIVVSRSWLGKVVAGPGASAKETESSAPPLVW